MASLTTSHGGSPPSENPGDESAEIQPQPPVSLTNSCDSVESQFADITKQFTTLTSADQKLPREFDMHDSVQSQIAAITLHFARLTLADQKSPPELEVLAVLDDKKSHEPAESNDPAVELQNKRQLNLNQSRLLAAPDEILLNIVKRLFKPWYLEINRNPIASANNKTEADTDARSPVRAEAKVEAGYPMEDKFVWYSNLMSTCHRLRNIAWTAGKESFSGRLEISYWHEDAMVKIQSLPYPVKHLVLAVKVFINKWCLSGSLQDAIETLRQQGLEEMTVVVDYQSQLQLCHKINDLRVPKHRLAIFMKSVTSHYQLRKVKTMLEIAEGPDTRMHRISFLELAKPRGWFSQSPW